MQLWVLSRYMLYDFVFNPFGVPRSTESSSCSAGPMLRCVDAHRLCGVRCVEEAGLDRHPKKNPTAGSSLQAGTRKLGSMSFRPSALTPSSSERPAEGPRPLNASGSHYACYAVQTWCDWPPGRKTLQDCTGRVRSCGEVLVVQRYS